MANDPRDVKVNPERSHTDSSLRTERRKTDRELRARKATGEKQADRVVEVARGRADEVLELAREKADDTRDDAEPEKSAGDADKKVSATRAAEDRTIVRERAAADDRLETERSEHTRESSHVLASERGKTDAHLRSERTYSDRAVAARDDFLAIVSHDVRGILASMAMSGDLLMRVAAEGVAGERTRLEGQRIRRLTAQMNRLVGDLLDVVSMEVGKLDVNPHADDAAAVLADTMEVFELAAADRKIEMTSEVGPGDLRASFDRDRVLQVMTNLVGNAMKFTRGKIDLRVAPAPGGGIEFTVRDDGCGIPEDRIEGVFERFSQGPDHDRTGLGLGLFIARSIVEAHGGRIWVDSVFGEGCTFHFTLPGAARG